LYARAQPENILCLDSDDDTKIMLSDFGLSKFATPAELMKIACGVRVVAWAKQRNWGV
jgi:hypothetical protein